MPRSPRDRISVDLQGLGAALEARATALGVTPSELVRRVLLDALHGEGATRSAGRPRKHATGEKRARMTLRMLGCDAEATRFAASRAGLSCGAYVAGLVAGVPAVIEGGAPGQYLSALTASNAEMADLARDLRRLRDLLQQGLTNAAQEYRDRFDRVDAAVRSHIIRTSIALAALQPRAGWWSSHADSHASRGEQS